MAAVAAVPMIAVLTEIPLKAAALMIAVVEILNQNTTTAVAVAAEEVAANECF